MGRRTWESTAVFVLSNGAIALSVALGVWAFHGPGWACVGFGSLAYLAAGVPAVVKGKA